MKLVTRYKTEFEAEDAANLLERNGIASYVSAKGPIHFPMGRGGASHTGLWVVLDTQLHEAQCLIENEEYVVINKLSASQLAEIKAGIRDPDMSVALGFLMKVLVAVAAFAAAVFFLTRG